MRAQRPRPSLILLITAAACNLHSAAGRAEPLPRADGYRGILVRALDAGYRLTPFREFELPAGGGDGRPVLLLRHDLDHDLRSAERVGELEAELGVRSTYFIQTASEFYNLLAHENRRIVRRLADLGHEIGLHYEARRYVGPEGERNLVSDLRLLEDLGGRRVVSAAQHIPIDDGVVNLKPHIEHEAYEPRFMTVPPMTYISDSLMAWRQATPHELLERRASFQFLTHPETWIGDFADIDDALLSLLAGEVSAVHRRYRDVIGYYKRLLRERAERDRAFWQQRRSGNGNHRRP